MDGFDDIPLSSFDFAPTVALRFEKQKLIDVSAEYQRFYDIQIAWLRSQLDGQALAAFKSSDGKVQAVASLPMDKLKPLQAAKIKVLEIVWCYLYSGREDEAWVTLAEMWPPADVNRIRQSILAARARGIRSDVDGASTSNSHLIWKHHGQVYNMDTESKGAAYMASGQETAVAPDIPSLDSGAGEKTTYSVDVGPNQSFSAHLCRIARMGRHSPLRYFFAS